LVLLKIFTHALKHATQVKKKQFGVPSGAGWHLIGNVVETVFNNLETSTIPVAIARTHNKQNSAYGLTETITGGLGYSQARLLQLRKDQFHWYVNPYPKEVCTEIWASFN